MLLTILYMTTFLLGFALAKQVTIHDFIPFDCKDPFNQKDNKLSPTHPKPLRREKLCCPPDDANSQIIRTLKEHELFHPDDQYGCIECTSKSFCPVHE